MHRTLMQPDQIVVSCDDLPPNTMSPVVEVAVWVGDEAGNWDYCVTTITVQDWMGACGGTMNAELSSSISNEDLEPIELVNVELTEPTAPRVQRLATAV